MSKVTILLETTTTDELKALGRKGQTYDQLTLQYVEEYHRCQQQQLQQATATAVVSKMQAPIITIEDGEQAKKFNLEQEEYKEHDP
jgi:hypothetical protein